MMKKQIVWPFILLLIMIILIVRFTISFQKKDLSEMKIVVILSGADDDYNWNAANRNGIRECSDKYGINIEYVENVKESDMESTLHVYGKKQYELIIAAGYQFNDAVEEVAPDYKDSMFCVINGTKLREKNTASVQLKEYEASYIAGLIAGYESQNGQFAAVGGYPNAGMKKLMDVYESTAVQTALKSGKNGAASRRVYINSWEDIHLGRMVTERMIDDGADIVFSYANKASLGSIQAASAKGVKYIGFSDNQNLINQETVIASVGFRFDKIYEWIIKRFHSKELYGEKVYKIGMNEEIFYPIYSDKIQKKTRDAVENGMEDMKRERISFE